MSAETLGYYVGFLIAVALLWLLIGTLNYAFTWRRLSYRQALTRPWVLGAGVMGLLVALLGQIAARI